MSRPVQPDSTPMHQSRNSSDDPNPVPLKTSPLKINSVKTGPEKTSTLTSPITKKRQDIAHQRSAMYQQIRAFFWRQAFSEVETPLISQAASTEPHLASVRASPWVNRQADLSSTQACVDPKSRSGDEQVSNFKRTGFLITSPEYPMKRLVAEWQKPIFQITKCFRALEQSPRHNPEFSMLEWYRPHAGLKVIEEDLIRLLETLSGRPVALERISYAQAFERETGLDPFTLSCDEAQAFALRHDLSFPENLDRLGWVDLIFSFKVEPKLGAPNLTSSNPKNSDKDSEAKRSPADPSNVTNRPIPLSATLIHDFLPEQASLAQTHIDDSGRSVALRFELYLSGLEIANAASELTDPALQLARFDADNQSRQKLGLPSMPIDHALIAAMQTLPPCSGIAVGLDRLLMVLSGCQTISEVLLYDATRA